MTSLLYVVIGLVLFCILSIGVVDYLLRNRRKCLYESSLLGEKEMSAYISRRNKTLRDLHEKGAYLDVIRHAAIAVDKMLGSGFITLEKELMVVFSVLSLGALTAGIVMIIIGNIVLFIQFLIIAIGLICFSLVMRDMIKNGRLIQTIFRNKKD